MIEKLTFNITHQITISEDDFTNIRDSIKDLISDYVWDNLDIPENTPYEFVENIRDSIYNAIIKREEN